MASKLLLDERPLQVMPCLATAIGLNEAIALQQLHWVLKNPAMGKVVDGVKYVHMTYTEWRTGHFPFWSEPTIQRAFNSLEDKGLIQSRSDLNQAHFDRTKWYRVDLEAVEKMESTFDQNPKIVAYKRVIDEHIKLKDGHSKLIPSSYQDEITIPENSEAENSEAENSQGGGENPPPAPDKPEPPDAPKGKPAKKARKEPANIPPSVKVFQSVRSHFPPRETWPQIEQTVGDDPAKLELWHAVLVGYAAAGFNRQCVDAPLEWFQRGQTSAGKGNGNGRNCGPPLDGATVGLDRREDAHVLTREDFTEARWNRLPPVRQQQILAGEVWSDGYNR